jgi:hypothetical protein
MYLNRRHILFFIPLLFISLLATGQRTQSTFNNAYELMTDASGKPFYLQVNYNIEGSPFYPPEYFKASLCAESGQIYRNVRVKFNMMDHLLLVKRSDGSEEVVTTPIYRLVYTDEGEDGIMEDRVFERGFPSPGAQTEKTWYEVLDSGKMKLLKLRTVNYMDKKNYGSGSITREFITEESLFLYSRASGMNKLSRGNEAVLLLLPGKREVLASYISEKGLKCKKENEIIQLVHYYNSLPN